MASGSKPINTLITKNFNIYWGELAAAFTAFPGDSANSLVHKTGFRKHSK